MYRDQFSDSDVPIVDARPVPIVSDHIRLFIFDLTDGDPEGLFELGVQRGLGNIPADAVFLLLTTPNQSL